MKNFNDEALGRLMTYHFSCNIIEMRNIVEYCVNICQNREIGVEHLPAEAGPHALVQSVPGPQPLQETGKNWPALEKELIISTLTQTRGNRSKAADILGWGRTTLWRKLKNHGLVTPPVPSNTKEEA